MTQFRHISAEHSTLGTIAQVLRLEGLIIAAAAIAFYWQMGGSWLIFALLILMPDVMMSGYLAGNRIGALVYNLGHSYIGPVAIGVLAFATNWTVGAHLSTIWLAHIGMDRALGYGLKYATGFDDTHLGRV
ncbi:Anthraniloyl-CoA monooxygenase [Sulfitobacter noctilucicola]|uniref:DUF4260 family protein n=1 Tax=Sulfitobacter noctilucicola TaxID=1342301 RepID=A0A7W6M8K5_9RHOB|nr:DUF4260 domain-containing protein [Sulfitobacter noctilucicola]KIN64387.1 Anthraniloyl-CoA monooxygenase [Sulfitobacter noctilucicola]MBB4174454.1 hypothetical protein [Sulfitobacter noctilucicola]